MRKYLLLGLVAAVMNVTELYANGSVKLVDYIISSSGLSEILKKNGITGTDSKQVVSYVSTSVNSFYRSADKQITKETLNELLVQLPVTGKDAHIRKELQLLLDKSEKDIKKEDLVAAVNHIIYLANRHGKSVIITCAECVSDSLMKSGFKFTVENIKNTTSINLLNDLIPNNPKDLNIFISSRVKRLNLGDYSKVTAKTMEPSDEKTFALYLALLENGSVEYKELGKAIAALSTQNGKTNLLDSSNPNKLWKIVSNDMASSEVLKLTSALKEADRMAKAENLKAEVAFNRVMKQKSEGSEELFIKYKNIKSKRCFFK